MLGFGESADSEYSDVVVLAECARGVYLFERASHAHGPGALEAEEFFALRVRRFHYTVGDEGQHIAWAKCERMVLVSHLVHHAEWEGAGQVYFLAIEVRRGIGGGGEEGCAIGQQMQRGARCEAAIHTAVNTAVECSEKGGGIGGMSGLG